MFIVGPRVIRKNFEDGSTSITDSLEYQHGLAMSTNYWLVNKMLKVAAKQQNVSLKQMLNDPEP